jgi:hypothetical protein
MAVTRLVKEPLAEPPPPHRRAANQRAEKKAKRSLGPEVAHPAAAIVVVRRPGPTTSPQQIIATKLQSADSVPPRTERSNAQTAQTQPPQQHSSQPAGFFAPSAGSAQGSRCVRRSWHRGAWWCSMHA